MIILFIILLIWYVVLTIDVINLEKKVNKIVKVVDEIFDEKQAQINDLYSKINKDDEPSL